MSNGKWWQISDGMVNAVLKDIEEKETAEKREARLLEIGGVFDTGWQCYLCKAPDSRVCGC